MARPRAKKSIHLDETPSTFTRLKRSIFGKPRDLNDTSLFHRLSLIPILAWIGMGADGLSSSSYGPDEAFRTLGQHGYLALLLAAAIAGTIFLISAAYSRIIEQFPHGGGGYVVATKLLGKKWGLVSGSALLVDYMLTITVSLVAAAEALFSFLPPEWQHWKLLVVIMMIVGLTTLNIRGVRESVLFLSPIFVLFVATHLILIVGGIVVKVPDIPATLSTAHQGWTAGVAQLGLFGMIFLAIHGYSMGAGTYTGLEAVSNGLSIMRAPQVHTGKRTMLYMALSLAFTAGGILLCYVLWSVVPLEGKTMNAALVEKVAAGWPLGQTLIYALLISEGALLIVGAQAGFIDGPRVLANMAVDSWAPRRFAALSERLTIANGIVLMGVAALVALVYTGGSLYHLVIMYSINVFITFSLSTFGMARYWFRARLTKPHWKRRTILFTTTFLLCFTILAMTMTMKFLEGGWVTLVVTGGVVGLALLINRHYRSVAEHVQHLYAQLKGMRFHNVGVPEDIDHRQPTAVVLVAKYNVLGMHTVLNIFRNFPDHFKNIVFISTGVIDSGVFKGEEALEDLREKTEKSLQEYMEMAHGLGVPAEYRFSIGTDAVDETTRLCLKVAEEFDVVTFFAGKLIFERERWYHRWLHNDLAFSVQKRLQLAGMPVVILPARVR